MLELKRNQLKFSFPDIHPDASIEITLHRTLRIPDDGKTYPLPPSLGSFPVRLVDDFKDRVPAQWIEHGGVMLPIYQSEAMWLSFQSNHSGLRDSGYPFAIKVATGKRSALTGDPWSTGLKAGDYTVSPGQPWLDGYVVEKGVVRQFVAAPLGAGFTAEEQITGKAEFGGLQIEVIPMKRTEYERRFPERRMVPISEVQDYMCCDFNSAPATDMGLAPGGRMKQQVFEDTFGLDAWDFSARHRCFVHLANSLVWRAITKKDPPHPPITAREYTNQGLPWFDYYKDDAKALEGKTTLKNLKSILATGFQKGFHFLPENESADPTRVIDVTPPKVLGPDEVREGSWT